MAKKKTVSQTIHENDWQPFPTPPHPAVKGAEWTHPKTGAKFVFNGSWWQNRDEAKDK